MKFDKQISRLLAKSLIVATGISCFSFNFVSAMEEPLRPEPISAFKPLVPVNLKSQDEEDNSCKKRLSPEIIKVNQCLRKTITSSKGGYLTLNKKYERTDFSKRNRLFALNIGDIDMETIHNFILNLRELNKEKPLTKDSAAYSLLATVEEIKKNIPKSYEPQGQVSDDQLALFNNYFAQIINSFSGAYKGKTQNNVANSLLKSLNIISSGKYAKEHPDEAKTRAKKILYGAISGLPDDNTINLKEEEKD